MIAAIENLPGGVPGFATGRGTAALIAAVGALDLNGRAILAPANLCAIAIAGLISAGVRPILHDVSPETGNATLDHIKAAWRPTVAGLLAVHNFGTPIDMPAIGVWARSLGLRIIEDVCNATGAEWQGHPIGRLGDVAFYSFGRGKIADAGEGGAVVANDVTLAERLERQVAAMPLLSEAARHADSVLEGSLRQLRAAQAPAAAQWAAYASYMPHIKTRLNEIEAARIDKVLSDLSRKLDHRREMAWLWHDRLACANVKRSPLGDADAPWRYNIRVEPKKRDIVIRELRLRGHSASTWYPPIDDIFVGEVETPVDYSGSHAFAAQVINLWTDETIDEKQVEAATAVIVELVGERQ